MRISRFINRIAISRKEKTRTSSGADSFNIVELLRCRGGVENTSVSSQLNADKETAVSSFKILLRTPTDITVKIDDLITDLDTNRIFTVILAPKYLEKNKVLELSCEETI